MSSVDFNSYLGQYAGKQLLKYHVGHEIFCPYCRTILDCRRAVNFDVETANGTVSNKIACGTCFDAAKERLEEFVAANGHKLTVLDGRVLFARTKRVAPKSYAVEVIADSSGKYIKNGLRFKTRKEAKAYGADLASRWTLVEEWRVVGTQEEPNR